MYNDRVTERPRIETYTVFLRNASGATVDRARGLGRIIDDDGPPPGSRAGGGAFDAWLLAMLALCASGAAVRNRCAAWRENADSCKPGVGAV